MCEKRGWEEVTIDGGFEGENGASSMLHRAKM